ncbi:MAG: hypothetical protein IPF57_10260 [Gammaproteobacteria bacterium]|nr:hypothetical protein [Gammaproteobacteria bacterium]
MELKRIIGPDVKTALRLVREQLGPDAMILSNRRVAGGVEIVAAPETHLPPPLPASRTSAGEPMLRAFDLAAGAAPVAPRPRPPAPERSRGRGGPGRPLAQRQMPRRRRLQPRALRLAKGRRWRRSGWKCNRSCAACARCWRSA